MSIVVELRHGGPSGDRALQRVLVTPPSGSDEMALAEAGMNPAAWANRLLAACVLEAETTAPIGLAAVSGLGLGDRERLLLSVHTVSFGPSADLLYRCGEPACGEVVELTVDLAAFLTASRDQPDEPDEPANAVVVRLDGGAGPVTCRLPVAGDLEAIAATAAEDLDAAAAALLARLVVSGPAADAPAVSTEALSEALTEAIQRRDPDAAIRVSLACPSCGAVGEALLDAGLLLRERFSGSADIFAEVDRLARAYHWSEADILALPRPRRQCYLGLIAQAETGR